MEDNSYFTMNTYVVTPHSRRDGSNDESQHTSQLMSIMEINPFYPFLSEALAYGFSEFRCRTVKGVPMIVTLTALVPGS